jgi:glycine/D-amino acid oxidase-like deaminating enzyme
MTCKCLGNVTVIGAGVIGLTTALLLQKEGYNVTIVANHFPGDKNINYTSPFAGARWKTVAPNSDSRLQSKKDRTSRGDLLIMYFRI